MSASIMQNQKTIGKSTATFTIILLLVASLIVASFLGYSVGYKAALKEISELQNQIQDLRQQIKDYNHSQTVLNVLSY